MMEFLNTPWKLDATRDDDAIFDIHCDMIADCLSPEYARRIVACVNACAELPQDALDGGWTALGMSRHARNVERQRDELLALVAAFHRKLETYRNVYSGDKELHLLLSKCEAAIAEVEL